MQGSACFGFVFGLLLSAWPAFAAPPKAPAAPAVPAPPATAVDQPAIENIDQDLLNRAVRAALAKAVQVLGNQMDENKDLGDWVAPLIPQRKIIEYKDVDYRYSEKVFKIPIWEYEYEMVEVLLPVFESGATVLKRVMTRRIKKQTKVGEKDETRLVYDPNGPITRTVKVPVYGPGGPDILPAGFVGDNAMALYALLRCGAAPDSERVQKIVKAIEANLFVYGLPDETWDLAWLTAAYSQMPTIRSPVVVERVIHKLLDGQFATGPAKGLWGPICINTARVSALIEYEKQLGLEIKRVEALAAKAPNNQAAAEQLLKLRGLRDGLAARMGDVARQGLRFDAVTGVLVVKDRQYNERDAIVPGLPYFFYGEAVADLESTALAVFALARAEERGLLPKATQAEKGLGGAVMLPAAASTLVLTRTAAAVAALQKRDGSWDEANFHLPVSDFDKQGLPKLPASKKLPPVASPATMLSTALGCAVSRELIDLLGGDSRAPQLVKALAVGEPKLAALVEEFLATPLPGAKPVKGVTPPVPSMPVGRANAPYDLVMALMGAHRRAGGSDEVRRDLWARTAYRMVVTQNPDGTWGAKRPWWKLSSGVEARADVQLRAKHETDQKAVPVDRRRPFNLAAVLPTLYPAVYWTSPGQLNTTVQTMLFLADGVRPPAAGKWRIGKDAGDSKALAEFASATIRDAGAVAGFRPLDGRCTDEDLARLPLVVVTGSEAGLGGLEAGDPIVGRLRRYLSEKGLVVVEAADTPAGRAFLTAASDKLLGRIEGLTAGPVPAVSPLLKDIAGDKPQLNGLLRKDGSVAAILLPISANKTPPVGSVAPATAALIIRKAVADRGDGRWPTREYATSLDGEGSLAAQHLQAVGELKAGVLRSLQPAGK